MALLKYLTLKFAKQESVFASTTVHWIFRLIKNMAKNENVVIFLQQTSGTPPPPPLLQPSSPQNWTTIFY